jgi:hypothetical protein
MTVVTWKDGNLPPRSHSRPVDILGGMTQTASRKAPLTARVATLHGELGLARVAAWRDKSGCSRHKDDLRHTVPPLQRNGIRPVGHGMLIMAGFKHVTQNAAASDHPDLPSAG